MKGPTLVLDTNVLVSGLSYPHSIPGKIVALWQTGSLSFFCSEYILAEADRVLPKMRAFVLRGENQAFLLRQLRTMSRLIEPSVMRIEGLRDLFDQQILGTLVASGADYLITGDKDLLALSDRYAIITPAAFWSLYSQSLEA